MYLHFIYVLNSKLFEKYIKKIFLIIFFRKNKINNSEIFGFILKKL